MFQCVLHEYVEKKLANIHPYIHLHFDVRFFFILYINIPTAMMDVLI